MYITPSLKQNKLDFIYNKYYHKYNLNSSVSLDLSFKSKDRGVFFLKLRGYVEHKEKEETISYFDLSANQSSDMKPFLNFDQMKNELSIASEINNLSNN